MLDLAFMNPGFLIIDKPAAWTSHDVVAKLRGLLKERKIGHLGTLDPLATGVLVVAVGRGATREISQYMKLDKEYEVEMELGKVSNTYDKEGELRSTGADLSLVTIEQIQGVLQGFWGRTLQMPPAFSAKKIGGRRAYALARAGKPVELRPVEVEMQGRDLKIELPYVRLTLTVSSGTYVRSFVHDVGERLGCGAVLTALRRTRVGPFELKDARQLNSFMS